MPSNSDRMAASDRRAEARQRRILEAEQAERAKHTEHIPYLAESDAQGDDEYKVYAYCSCGWESMTYWDSRAEAALDYVDNHPGFPKYPSEG